jgi:hypothetical protein
MIDTSTALRLVQLTGPGARRVARVELDRLRLLDGVSSVYEIASIALAGGALLAKCVESMLSPQTLNYDEVYEGRSAWRILPSADHPLEPARCLVSGTGLTHMASASRRNAMHAADPKNETDSMRMFRWGIEGGKPAPGTIGSAPEWFYKGSGAILRGHGEPLVIPSFAEDGGEEPEIAGVYIVSGTGDPYRIGFTIGNEFSDHKIEKANYLYLAHSKLRTCAIGPELVVDADFTLVQGNVCIERDGRTLWRHEITSGESTMCHSLANIEHHHFKYEQHRRPGDLHVHFFGADAFSFGDGIQLEQGDVMCVEFAGFGRALRNPVHREQPPEHMITVQPLG